MTLVLEAGARPVRAGVCVATRARAALRRARRLAVKAAGSTGDASARDAAVRAVGEVASPLGSAVPHVAIALAAVSVRGRSARTRDAHDDAEKDEDRGDEQQAAAANICSNMFGRWVSPPPPLTAHAAGVSAMRMRSTSAAASARPSSRAAFA